MVAQKKSSKQRRHWNALSETYRRRLGRAGISQRDYENGASLSAARGHSKTPEKPTRAAKNPARYPEYVRKHNIEAPRPSAVKLDKLVTRIRLASPLQAKTTVRKAIIRLTEVERIELALRLGVRESFPLFDEFRYPAKLRVAEGWLLAFMTHAGTNASSEPWLRYVRRSPAIKRDWVSEYWDGPGVIDIAYAEYRHLNSRGRLTDRDIFANFKSQYMDFFGNTAIRGKATPA